MTSQATDFKASALTMKLESFRIIQNLPESCLSMHSEVSLCHGSAAAVFVLQYCDITRYHDLDIGEVDHLQSEAVCQTCQDKLQSRMLQS